MGSIALRAHGFGSHGALKVGIKIESLVVPGSVLKNDVAEHVVADCEWLGTAHSGPADFAATFKAGSDRLLCTRVGYAGIDGARGGDLGRRETGGAIGVFTLKHRGIEMATRGIFDHTVFHTHRERHLQESRAALWTWSRT